MKVLVLGDVHIKVSNILETEEMSKKILELAKKEVPKFIVLLGDILDRHATINVHCLMRAQNLIHSLSLIAPTYVLIGNHDRPNNSNFLTDEHPFNSLKLWPNTYIIDTPLDKTFELDEENNENENKENNKKYRFLFVPYVMPGRFDEALQKMENPYDKNISAIFAHQEFHLCKMGAIISQIGDKWDTDFPLTISGHIHNFDVLQANMIYTGTPLQHGYHDDDGKTVSMFTFENNSFVHERINLGLIKKIIVYITPEQVAEYEPPLDKLVKLIIKGEESEIKSVIKLNKISELKKQGVVVAFKTIQNVEEFNSSSPSFPSFPSSPHVYKPRVTYRERLMSEIQDSNELLSWFNKIF